MTTRVGTCWDALKCIVHPRISRERAVELAREECARREVPWREPVDVLNRLLSYTVISGVQHAKGGDAWISVSKRDGRILRFWRGYVR